MNRLVAFGCSLTYGEYLEDRDTQSWPAQLGKMLGVDAVNISVPGDSNKAILYNILNFDFQEGDVCVILWTNPYRWTIFNDGSKEDEIIRLGAWQNTPRALAFVEHFWDEHDMTLDMLEKSSHVQLRLEKKNIPVYHAVSSFAFGHTVPEQKWSCANWLDIDFQIIRDKYEKASDGKHPGPLAYKEFADIIAKIIK